MVRFPSDEAARHAAVVLLVNDSAERAVSFECRALLGLADNGLIPELTHVMVNLLTLQGYLALLAPPGGRGLQAGHVVAYRPTHTLLAAFLRRMQPFLRVTNEL